MQTYECEELVIHKCKCNATNRQLIMWCFHNSIHNKHCIWIWSRKISICFDTNGNKFTKLHKQQIHLSLPKIWINMTYISFLKKQLIVTGRVKQCGAQVWDVQTFWLHRNAMLVIGFLKKFIKQAWFQIFKQGRWSVSMWLCTVFKCLQSTRFYLAGIRYIHVFLYSVQAWDRTLQHFPPGDHFKDRCKRHLVGSTFLDIGEVMLWSRSWWYNHLSISIMLLETTVQKPNFCPMAVKKYSS